jgi:release factor glutamine methyltransferase
MWRRSSVNETATVSAPVSGSVRTIGDLLEALSIQIASNQQLESRSEARDIVAALLDTPRFWPAGNADSLAAPELVAAALRAALKRAAGAPLAYAVGRAPFRHLTLEVDETVLIPRVETEILVERVLERSSPGIRTIADIGTGSGAIALSLALEHGFEKVIGTDISRGALEVARNNARLLNRSLRSPIEFRHGALLAPLAGQQVDAIVSNPPYIAYAEGTTLPRAVRDWEPALALVCADDGLAVTRSIVARAPAVLAPGGILALEVDTRRAGLVAEMVAVNGSYTEIEVLLDLTGRDRFVFAKRG